VSNPALFAHAVILLWLLCLDDEQQGRWLFGDALDAMCGLAHRPPLFSNPDRLWTQLTGGRRANVWIWRAAGGASNEQLRPSPLPSAWNERARGLNRSTIAVTYRPIEACAW
jgi:hypothetical protein